MGFFISILELTPVPAGPVPDFETAAGFADTAGAGKCDVAAGEPPGTGGIT